MKIFSTIKNLQVKMKVDLKIIMLTYIGKTSSLTTIPSRTWLKSRLGTKRFSGYKMFLKYGILTPVGEIYSYDNEPGNESQHNDTIFGWLTDQIGRETKKFMDFVQPYTNISMYF